MTSPTPSSRRTRARRGEGERLRNEIVDATERLLTQTKDPDAVSIRAVADAVGVTPPSIYLHFSDKDELLFAVCERHFSRLAAMSEQAARGFEDPMQELKARARAYIRFGVENPEPYRILFMSKPGRAPESFDSERLRSSASFGRLVENVLRCMEAGAIAADDPFTVAFACWTVVHGMTSLFISLPPVPDDFAERVIEYVLEMVNQGTREHLSSAGHSEVGVSPGAARRSTRGS